MLLVGAVLIDISNCTYEKTFLAEITLRSPQIQALMILAFISAIFWGCLGWDKFLHRNISTKRMEEEESTFLIQRHILVRDTLQLKQLSDFNIKKVLYSWGVFLITLMAIQVFVMSV